MSGDTKRTKRCQGLVAKQRSQEEDWFSVPVCFVTFRKEIDLSPSLTLFNAVRHLDDQLALQRFGCPRQFYSHSHFNHKQNKFEATQQQHTKSRRSDSMSNRFSFSAVLSPFFGSSRAAAEQ